MLFCNTKDFAFIVEHQHNAADQTKHARAHRRHTITKAVCAERGKTRENNHREALPEFEAERARRKEHSLTTFAREPAVRFCAICDHRLRQYSENRKRKRAENHEKQSLRELVDRYNAEKVDCGAVVSAERARKRGERKDNREKQERQEQDFLFAEPPRHRVYRDIEQKRNRRHQHQKQRLPRFWKSD